MQRPIQIEEEIQFLNPKAIKIRQNTFGEMVVEMPDGSTYTGVVPVRTFPLSQPNRYISLHDSEHEEIGLIEDLRQLNKADRAVLREELQKCYFMPRITRILSLEGQFGITQWEVETDRGPVSFALRSRYDIVSLDGGRVLIKDVDGNRYEIPDYRKLDPKSIALFETQT